MTDAISRKSSGNTASEPIVGRGRSVGIAVALACLGLLAAEMALQVRAPAPRDGGMLPLSSVTHRYRREAGAWTPAGPPAAASS